MGSARPYRPKAELLDVVAAAALETWGPGTQITIGSGSEVDYHGDSKRRPQYGSTRHQTGLAGDFTFTRPDGSLVGYGADEMADFFLSASRHGILGTGYGKDYMGPAVHLDMMPREDYSSGQGPFWGGYFTSDQNAGLRNKMLEVSNSRRDTKGWAGPILSAAKRHGIPPDLALALTWQESKFDPEAKSNKDAYGLMQLRQGAAKDMGVNRFDPMENIDGGMGYLARQFKKYGDWDLAMAAYNAGSGNVDKHNGIPPFKETRDYIKRINNKRKDYAWATLVGGSGNDSWLGKQKDVGVNLFDPRDADPILTELAALTGASGMARAPVAQDPLAEELAALTGPAVAAESDKHLYTSLPGDTDAMDVLDLVKVAPRPEQDSGTGTATPAPAGSDGPGGLFGDMGAFDWASAIAPAPEYPKSLSTDYIRGRQNSGTNALKRFGIASLA